jgi:hypothetical protein
MEERKLNLFSLVNSVLAGVMAVCFAVAVGRAFGVAGTAWVMDMLAGQRELIALGFLVALEVQLTRRLREPVEVASAVWLRRIATEWGTLFLTVLAVTWIRNGPPLAWRDVPALARLTAGVISMPEFFAGLFLALLVWALSRYLASDLIALENMPVAYSRESERGIAEEQNAARLRIWQDVFIIGGLMVILSVLTVPVLRVTAGLPAAFGSLGPEVLVFFLCGLGVFTVGRLMLLRAEWLTERTGIDPSVSRQWIGYGLAFIVLLLVLAVVLPTEYSFRLLSSLELVLDALSAIGSILAVAIYLVFTWFLSLFLPPMEGAEGLNLPIPPEAAGTAAALPAGISWETVFREFLFWGIALLVLVYVLRQLPPLRRGVARRLRQWRWFRAVLDFFRRLRKGWRAWSRKVADTVRGSWTALRADVAARLGVRAAGFLSLRGLDPRQTIRFYFFALLRRGAERGVVRRPAQTPREYAASLSAEEDLIAVELREMALAFEEARYTNHAIGAERARRVRKVWDTIRIILRSAKPGERQNGGVPNGD